MPPSGSSATRGGHPHSHPRPPRPGRNPPARRAADPATRRYAGNAIHPRRQPCERRPPRQWPGPQRSGKGGGDGGDGGGGRRGPLPRPPQRAVPRPKALPLPHSRVGEGRHPKLVDPRAPAHTSRAAPTAAASANMRPERTTSNRATSNAEDASWSPPAAGHGAEPHARPAPPRLGTGGFKAMRPDCAVTPPGGALQRAQGGVEVYRTGPPNSWRRTHAQPVLTRAATRCVSRSTEQERCAFPPLDMDRLNATHRRER